MSHAVSPRRSMPGAASATARRTRPPRRRRSSARSRPLATSAPSPSSMRNRTRRWSGTLARSKSPAATGSPDSVASRRASTSRSGPSSGPIAAQRLAGPVGRRHQVAADLLRQRADQRGDQVEAVPRHLPVEAVGADLVEHGQRHVHGHAVVGGAGAERVGHVEGQVALVPRGREGVEVEAVGGRSSRSARVRVSRSGSVRRASFHQRSKWRADTTSSGTRSSKKAAIRSLVTSRSRRRVRSSSSSSSSTSARLAATKRVVGAPVAVDQGVLDEQRAGERGVDAAELHPPTVDDRQAVERDALGRHGRAPAPVPPRLAVGAAHQVLGCGLDPRRVDAGGHAGPHPVGLDQLAGHDPGGGLPVEDRAAGDGEVRLAGADVVAGGAVVHADVREQPGQQRPVDLVG